MSKHLAAVWVLDIQIDRDEVSLLVILQDVAAREGAEGLGK